MIKVSIVFLTSHLPPPANGRAPPPCPAYHCDVTGSSGMRVTVTIEVGVGVGSGPRTVMKVVTTVGVGPLTLMMVPTVTVTTLPLSPPLELGW